MNPLFKQLATMIAQISIALSGQAQEFTVTAYCHCEICTPGTGITASGVKPVEGVTVAAHKGLPFGTRILIHGHGLRVVQDRGGAITGQKLDIYFASHAKALKFGRKKLYAVVLTK